MPQKVHRLTALDPRIPAWSEVVERPCPVCDQEGLERFIRPDGLIVHECSCGTFYVSPAPSNAALENFYRYYDQGHRHGPTVTVKILRQMVRDFDPLKDFRFQEIASLVDLKDARCLDVGCGWGAFLAGFYRLGGRPTGIDLDVRVVEAARQAMPFADVRVGTISEIEGDSSWRVIVMNDYIEHPLAPMEDLRNAVRLLEPSGILLIWTPNASFANVDREPLLFRVDLEHLQYLTFKSVAYISRVLGLEVVHLESAGFPDLSKFLESPSLLKRTRMGLRRIPFANRIYRSFRELFLGPQTDRFRLGRYHLFAVFRKVSRLDADP